METRPTEAVREMIAYALKQTGRAEFNQLNHRDYGVRDAAAWRIAERIHAQLKLCGCDVVKLREGSRNYEEPAPD